MENDTENTKTAPALTAASGSGAALIAAERQRQMAVEGWTPEHDDQHSQAEMAKAAGDYLHEAFIRAKYGRRPFGTEPPHHWPWDAKWWKPSEDPIPNLVKAGALIAAEIDRLQRLQNTED